MSFFVCFYLGCTTFSIMFNGMRMCTLQKCVCVRGILNLRHMLWIRLNLKTWCWQRHLTLHNHCPLLTTSIGLFLQSLPGYIKVKMKMLLPPLMAYLNILLQLMKLCPSGYWLLSSLDSRCPSPYLQEKENLALFLTSSNADLRVTVISTFCISLFYNSSTHFHSSLFSRLL